MYVLYIPLVMIHFLRQCLVHVRDRGCLTTPVPNFKRHNSLAMLIEDVRSQIHCTSPKKILLLPCTLVVIRHFPSFEHVNLLA